MRERGVERERERESREKRERERERERGREREREREKEGERERGEGGKSNMMSLIHTHTQYPSQNTYVHNYITTKCTNLIIISLSTSHFE